MTIIVLLLFGFLGIISIVSLVCFIMVVVKMFQHDQTGLGIACIVLALCTGFGSLIAFVYGWVKASEWKIQPLMIVWTGTVVLSLIMVPVVLVTTTMLGERANSTFMTVGSSLSMPPTQGRP